MSWSSYFDLFSTFLLFLIDLSAKVAPPTSGSDTSGMLTHITLQHYLSLCTVTCLMHCTDRQFNTKSLSDNKWWKSHIYSIHFILHYIIIIYRRSEVQHVWRQFRWCRSVQTAFQVRSCDNFYTSICIHPASHSNWNILLLNIIYSLY